MSSIKLLSATLLVLLFNTAHAQSWFETKSETWTLKQIQDSFYSTYKELPIDKDEKDGVEREDENKLLFMRWEAYWKKRMRPEDHFASPSASYEAWDSYVQKHQQTFSRTQSTANWIFKGPLSSYGGYSGIGKLNCIGFHPTDPNTFWAGSAYGGLWKTTDGGATWSTNPGGMTNSGINAIAINPANANIMYLVTAQNYGGVTRNTGVLKSTDGGNTWNVTTLIYPASNNIRFRKIIIHPTNPDILMVAASNGIWKSIDAGATWNLYQTGSFHDIKFNPGNPSIVYASTYINSGGSYTASIYRSLNTGSSWTSVFTLPGAGYTVLAVSPNNPNLVLSVSTGQDGGLFGLCRSTNDGASFNLFFQAGPTTNLMSYEYDGSGSGGQGSYDLTLAINPANQNDVWLGAINTWNSANQGMQWTIKSHWAGQNGIPEVHADKHFHAFNPLLPNTIFECNDGGIYKSTNGGVSWTDLTNGMGISQMYKISVANSTNEKVLAGLQDNGSKHFSGQKWDDVNGGDGFQCIIDYADTNVLYTSIYNGYIDKSTNNGATWNNIVNYSGTGVNSSSSFYTNFTIHPANNNTLLIGKDQIYRTTNGGNSWSQLGTLTNVQSGSEWAITYAPSDPQVIYGANGVNLYKTINGGTTWTNLPQPSGYVSSIAVDPLNPLNLWLAYSYTSGAGRIYQSTDGGQTFTNLMGTIPSGISINCIVYENGSKGGLYAGTDIGVFYRDSTMSDWVYYNDGLPNIVVNDLQISYANHKLWAGTYGRGLWNTDLYTILPLTLVEFTAKAVNKTAALQWLTSGEVNTKEFVVERSADGSNKWTAIGSVNARNTSLNNTYSFTDNEPINGYNYYRLKMADKDGKYTYSGIRVVSFKERNESITVVPNPASDFANIIFNGNMNTAEITLYDSEGRRVFEKQVKEAGTKLYRLNTKTFSPGVYIINVKSNIGNISEKLIIQNASF